MNKSPELPYYARLFESPELYWSFHKLCSYEAPLRRPFLKILYENADKCKKELDAETLKTSKLSNKIICRPPQSRETIPLNGSLLHHYLKYEMVGWKKRMSNKEKQVCRVIAFAFWPSSKSWRAWWHYNNHCQKLYDLRPIPANISVGSLNLFKFPNGLFQYLSWVRKIAIGTVWMKRFVCIF